MSLLEVSGLRVGYKMGRGRWREVVRGVSFELASGESLGLVGESGCGKTTLAMALVRLVPTSSGRIRFKGEEIQNLSQRRLRPLRRGFQIVFQDPRASLDPRWPVGRTIQEPLKALRPDLSPAERRERVARLLEDVGLEASVAERYPGELSGGQRQRVAIARALAPGPSLLVADEPTSALDVSVQAQVVNLIKRLQRRRGLGLLFVSHDIHLVSVLCDRLLVMYGGMVMESGPAGRVLARPYHPYTQMLAAAAPSVRGRSKVAARGTSHEDRNRGVDMGQAEGSGCPFRHRCPLKDLPAQCTTLVPRLTEVEPGRWVACHALGREGGDGTEAGPAS